MAFGGGYSTTFSVMNTGASQVSTAINFYGQNGNLRTDLSRAINVPARGSTRFTIPNTGSGISVVWGELLAGAGSFKGVASFDLRASNNTLITTAGVLGVLAGNSFNLPVELTTPVTGMTKLVYTPPFPDKRYSLAPGETSTQTSTFTTTTTYTGLPTTTMTTTQTETVKYLGHETVTVPAGTFETCKFEFPNVTSWEAVNTGVQVKSLSADTGGGTTTMQLTAGSMNGSPVQ